MNRASSRPLEMLPNRKPPMAWGPPIKPTIRVEMMVIRPAGISSFRAPVVAMSIHFP